MPAALFLLIQATQSRKSPSQRPERCVLTTAAEWQVIALVHLRMTVNYLMFQVIALVQLRTTIYKPLDDHHSRVLPIHESSPVHVEIAARVLHVRAWWMQQLCFKPFVQLMQTQ